jgi:hypothetical protein
VQCLISLSDGLAGYTFPLSPSRSKNYPWVQLGLCAHRAHSAPLRCPKLSQPAGLRTVRAMLNAGWPALLAALSFLLTTNLSDSLFGDALGALLSPRDAFRTALAKFALHHTSLPRSTSSNTHCLRYAPPSHLRDSRSVWREVGEVAPHHSHQDLAW